MKSLIGESIKKISSKTICSIIALYTKYNMDKNFLEDCMNELSSRRLNGEIFNFEDEIQNKLKEFAEIKVDYNELFNE